LVTLKNRRPNSTAASEIRSKVESNNEPKVVVFWVYRASAPSKISNKPAARTSTPPMRRRPVAITVAAVILTTRPSQVKISGVIPVLHKAGKIGPVILLPIVLQKLDRSVLIVTI